MSYIHIKIYSQGLDQKKKIYSQGLFIILFETGSSASAIPYMNLKRSHGVLNILGWGILIIMGAIVARHFKEWDPFWFNFHASVQSLGFVLGVIGVISGLVLNNQLHVDVNLHKALGIIILVLGCLQVFFLIKTKLLIYLFIGIIIKSLFLNPYLFYSHNFLFLTLSVENFHQFIYIYIFKNC